MLNFCALSMNLNQKEYEMLSDRNFTAEDFGHEATGRLPERSEIEILIEERTRARLQGDVERRREFRDKELKIYKKAAYITLSVSPLIGAFESVARPVRIFTHAARSLKAYFNDDLKTALESGICAGAAATITAGVGTAAFLTGTGAVGYVGLNVALAVLGATYVTFKYEPVVMKKNNERLESAEADLVTFEQTVAERHKPTLQ